MELLSLFLAVLQQERDRLQALTEKLAWEIKLLQESVTASETRANTATARNHSLEQELQTTVSLLKIKNEEMEMQREKIQVLQKEAAQGKALQENLTHVTAILSEREGEMKVYQEQMRLLEKQKEMHKTALERFLSSPEPLQVLQRLLLKFTQVQKLGTGNWFSPVSASLANVSWLGFGMERTGHS